MSAKPRSFDYAAWTLSAVSMIIILQFRLLPALIAGLMIYELVHAIHPVFAGRLSTRRAKSISILIVALLVIGVLGAASFGIFVFVRSEGGSLSVLLAKMADIIETSRANLPLWLASFLPDSSVELGNRLSFWLREHASDLESIGRRTGHSFAQILIGMVIGAMVSLRDVLEVERQLPLARALAERIFRLGEAFRRIVFAQIRISALNTTLTTVYLAVILPLMGVQLPLTKTMIVVTFIAGLLPVIGNLLSNTVIVIVSFSHSPQIAMLSLCYLILIHKLEYFLNARIVGGQISAKAWELLTAMLVMESIFGLSGLVAAPICYAWLKDELHQRGLV